MHVLIVHYTPLFLIRISITTSVTTMIRQERDTSMPTTRGSTDAGEDGVISRVGEGRAVLVGVCEEDSKLVKIKVDICLSQEGNSILMNDECGIASEGRMTVGIEGLSVRVSMLRKLLSPTPAPF